MFGNLLLKVPGVELALLAYQVSKELLMDPYRIQDSQPTVRDIRIDETGLAVLADDTCQPPVPLRLGHKVTTAQLAAALGPSSVLEEARQSPERGKRFVRYEQMEEVEEEMREAGLENLLHPQQMEIPVHD